MAFEAVFREREAAGKKKEIQKYETEPVCVRRNSKTSKVKVGSGYQSDLVAGVPPSWRKKEKY